MSSKYVTIEKEDAEIVYEVVKEAKPPSKLKEIITFLLIGVGGGFGLGVLIYALR